MTASSILDSKRNEIICIIEKYGARNVRVFGSIARHEDDENSDIDLLVELDKESSLLQHSAMIRELETLLERKVDVVSDRGLRPRIRKRVLKEAIVL